MGAMLAPQRDVHYHIPMSKIISTLVIVAVAVGAYAYWESRNERVVGDPVLSATPAGPESSLGPVTLRDGTYKLVAASSSMEWTGTKTLILNYTDRGTIALTAGTATVQDGKVATGSVTVDMTSIKTLKTGKGSGEDLEERHLKSADFFDVVKYPTSVFTFERIEPASTSGQFTVLGTLSIKGVVKPVRFPAKLSSDGDTLTMKATAILDRTLWGIQYASGKFFKELGDKVIGDEFTVTFTVVGRRMVQ